MQIKTKRRNKKIIIGNWKMAPVTMKEAKSLFIAIKKTGSKLSNIQTVICPPSIYLSELGQLIGGHRCVLGAQNSFRNEETAHTGEVSSEMLKGVGATYVILGHSERREMFETNEIVNKKVKLCLKRGMKVVLCVGEKERDDHGLFTKFIERELKESLEGVSKKLSSNLIVSYEPIWAIGKNAKEVCSPEDFLEISILTRKILADIYGRSIAMDTPVLYGGSVNPKNAEGFLFAGKADGLLVGRASLIPKKFNEILEIANRLA